MRSPENCSGLGSASSHPGMSESQAPGYSGAHLPSRQQPCSYPGSSFTPEPQHPLPRLEPSLCPTGLQGHCPRPAILRAHGLHPYWPGLGLWEGICRPAWQLFARSQGAAGRGPRPPRGPLSVGTKEIPLSLEGPAQGSAEGRVDTTGSSHPTEASKASGTGRVSASHSATRHPRHPGPRRRPEGHGPTLGPEASPKTHEQRCRAEVNRRASPGRLELREERGSQRF